MLNTLNPRELSDNLYVFEEGNWDFINGLNENVLNYKYYGTVTEVIDIGIHSKAIKIKLIVLTTIINLCVMTLLAGTAIFVKIKLDSMKEDEFITALEMTRNKIEFVDGEEQSSDVVIKISELLSAYFENLHNDDNYEYVNSFCTTNSGFYNAYNSFKEKADTTYDFNDCMSRYLRLLDNSCNIINVNRVIKKDNIYYCYCNLSIPKVEDIDNYINLYKYNFMRYFSSHEKTDENVLRFLLESFKLNPLSCTPDIYCIQVQVNKKGQFKIIDDTFISEACLNFIESTMSNLDVLLTEQELKK